MGHQRGLVLALCVLVMLAAHAHAQGSSSQNENAQYLTGYPIGPLYHSSDDILARLNMLAKGAQWPAVSLVSIPDTLTSSSHSMYRILNPRRSPPTAQQLQAMPTVFIICNQHAREVITAELCFWLVRLLSGDSRSLLEWPEFRAALGAARRVRGVNSNVALLRQWTQNLTSRVKVEVVPIVNIDGRKLIEQQGDYNLRKNPYGVDLNRNWRVNRAAPNSGADELDRSSEVYAGTGPLTEWETRSLFSYMQNQLSQPTGRGLFMDIHSGMWALMSPWSGKFEMSDIPWPDIAASQSLLDAMQPPLRDCQGRGIAAGPGAGLLYRAYGSADDTAGQLKFRQALTAEVYGPIGDDPYVVDSGWSYECPNLRLFRSSCSDDAAKSGAPCGDVACKNKEGTPMPPMPYMRAKSLAAFKAAEADNATAGGDVASTAQVSGAGPNIDPCPVPQPSQAPLNTADDPFMRYMDTGDFATFTYFNPVNAGQYRDAVSRWCVGMLLAIENFATRPQQQATVAGGSGNVVTP